MVTKACRKRRGLATLSSLDTAFSANLGLLQCPQVSPMLTDSQHQSSLLSHRVGEQV